MLSLTLALSYAWGGLDPRGYRAFNLALHVAVATLLFALVRRALSSWPPGALQHREATPLAAGAAALWCVHPLASECVLYVTQRSESLMALCLLATLLGVSGAASASGPRARRRAGGLAVAACTIGMLCKEVMVVAPLLALLFDASYHAGSLRLALRSRAGLHAGLAASWLLLLAILLWEPRAESAGFALGVPVSIYLANQAQVVTDYLQRVVWPHPLIFDYGWPRALGWGEVWPEALLLGGLGVAVLVLFLRRPRSGFPLLAAALVLAPTSSLLPIASEVGAERRVYLPLAGLLAWGVVTGRWLLERGLPSGWARRTAVALALGAGLALALTARGRVADYASAERLWRSVVEARPDTPRALANLGDALRAEGRLDEADALLERALALHPPFARAEALRGSVALSRGDLAAAERHLRRAIELDPRRGDVRDRLAVLLVESGRPEEALAQWRAALAREPDQPLVANNLAWWLATHPDPGLRGGASALHWAERAVWLSARRDPEILDTLAAAYAELGRLAEARAVLEEALGLAPDGPVAAQLREHAALLEAGRPIRSAVPSR